MTTALSSWPRLLVPVAVVSAVALGAELHPGAAPETQRGSKPGGEFLELRRELGAGREGLSHPDLAATGEQLWLAALGTGREGPEVLVGEVYPHTRSELQPIGAGGVALPPRIEADGAGGLVAVWPELGAPVAGQRPSVLCMRRIAPDGSIGPVEHLTQGGVAAEPALAFGADGALHVAWASFEAGSWEVRARRIRGDQRAEWNLSEDPASDQQPALGRAPDGSLWVAWSSYRAGSYATGNYEILARRIDADGPGPVVQVSVSNGPDLAPEFAETDSGSGLALVWTVSSHRKVAVQGIAASAYDAWYDRAYAVSRWSPEGWSAPRELEQGESQAATALDRVRPAAGRDGELLLFHHQVLTTSRGRDKNPRSLSVRRLAADGTSDFLNLAFGSKGAAQRVGRPGAAQRIGLARLHGRVFVADWCESSPQEPGWLRLVGLPLEGLEARRGATLSAPRERPPLPVEDLAKGPEPRPALALGGSPDGVELRAYFGNLHVHTDYSVDGRAADGPAEHNLMTLRDVARLDFVSLTDHTRRIDPEEWRHLWALTELWNRPGEFVTLHGFEWSSSVLGHKNVIFRDADTAAERGPLAQVTTAEALFDHIRGGEALAIPHHPSHLGGHDWSLRDDELQRLVEIFQKRGGYEFDGSPLAGQGTGSKRWIDGRSVRDALAAGHRLGIIASPDHGGGLGLAGVWAEAHQRDAIYGALHQRRTFGTTGAKLALWLEVAGRPQGSFDAPRPAEGAGPTVACDARVWGTGGRLKLVLVVEGEELAVERFEGPRVEHRFEVELPGDPAPDRGPYVYLRVEQDDGHVGWTSPVWFEPRR